MTAQLQERANTDVTEYLVAVTANVTVTAVTSSAILELSMGTGNAKHIHLPYTVRLLIYFAQYYLLLTISGSPGSQPKIFPSTYY